jgi:two-component system NtrC family sensor kinase
MLAPPPDARPARPTEAPPGAPLATRANGFALLWAGAIAIPLLLFLAAAGWTWRGVEAEARARLLRTVDMLHEHALRSFETQETALEAIDERVRGLSWDEIARSTEIQRFLAALDRRSQPSGGIALVGPDARLKVISATYPAPPVDLSDRGYVRAHRAGATGTYVGEVIVSRPSNTTVFSLSRSRTGGEVPFDGAIVATFKPGYFEDFYRSVTEGGGDVVTLVRADGAVLARTPPVPDPAIYQPGRFSPLVAAAQAAVDGGILRQRSTIDGVDRLYGFRKVGAYPVYVFYGLNPSVLRGAWASRLAAPGLVCLVASLLLGALTLRVQSSVRREQGALAAAGAEAVRRADAEARLRHAQRIEALGQIVGGVAHDFNNIVQNVQAATNRLQRRAEEPDEVRRVAGLMGSVAERGARLTQRMLAYARRQEAVTERFDMADALGGVHALLDDTLGSRYHVALDLAPDLPPARADQSELETVVVNLVLNARDAMPDGGTITVAAAPETVAEGVAPPAPALKPRLYVRVSVTDRGTGMDEATLARAAEAFFTTKEPGRGTGLGLAMARAFAEGAGGALAIASRPNEGTVVTLWLPAAPDEPPPAHG